MSLLGGKKRERRGKGEGEKEREREKQNEIWKHTDIHREEGA